MRVCVCDKLFKRLSSFGFNPRRQQLTTVVLYIYSTLNSSDCSRNYHDTILKRSVRHFFGYIGSCIFLWRSLRCTLRGFYCTLKNFPAVDDDNSNTHNNYNAINKLFIIYILLYKHSIDMKYIYYHDCYIMTVDLLLLTRTEQKKKKRLEIQHYCHENCNRWNSINAQASTTSSHRIVRTHNYI